jgi:protein-S-isoprenylcysteine O-methyltransferase Ste14
MGRRLASVAGSLVFLLIAPGTVAGLGPRWISGWRMAAELFPGARGVGVALIVCGLPMLLESFARFALHGLGTPAPVFPTKRLVVTGLYRHVRNPMYVGVVAIILGQGLLLGSWPVLEYGAVVWLGFHLFVLLYEEPTLRRSYGAEYEEFTRHVRRWIPRARPWASPRSDATGPATPRRDA